MNLIISIIAIFISIIAVYYTRSHFLKDREREYRELAIKFISKQKRVEDLYYLLKREHFKINNAENKHTDFYSEIDEFIFEISSTSDAVEKMLKSKKVKIDNSLYLLLLDIYERLDYFEHWFISRFERFKNYNQNELDKSKDLLEKLNNKINH